MRVGVFRENALDQGARVGVSGYDSGRPVVLGNGMYPLVKPEIGFLGLGIGTMAEKTIVGENGPYMAVELHAFRHGFGRGDAGRRNEEEEAGYLREDLV